MYTHTMQSVFNDPALLSSLSSYAYARHATLAEGDLLEQQTASEQRRSLTASPSTSFLLLQILAAADYYSLDKDLMKNVPPVHADVILDRYLLNVFPKSLLPTGLYLVIIGVVGWFLSGWFWDHLVIPFSGRDAALEDKKSQ